MYQRLLLKISGNSFSDPMGQGLDFSAIDKIAEEIISIHKEGVEVAIVNGAGNIFRGRSRPRNFDQVAADKIGLMSTIPNSLALLEVLNSKGIDTRIMCSFEIPGTARQFDAFKARSLLSNKKVVIITGGTGNPFFSTDTTAVLRALEIKADLLIKATDVAGVYAEDPQKNPRAKRYEKLSYEEALEKKLGVMDQTAFILAQENKLKILVYKFEPGSLKKLLDSPALGTMVS
ncbi:MAG: UMP kinase [Candidatus Jacksonbacteria bacterium RIFOXYC2_FULL_44_29]|nr:MAG: Uridylate kinase [Parcubacteria group bacterium GW2011_GWC2_44_22]OGY75745.1 MAG: UMP kinase [Candidatus Jacksonbacteria bacterium RIFOXYA2_FULL_43_12]OGY76311.1 MAG: UMP kinase [Candidatus Jacksonbacteria bacterium RIFOXYB2_FULL_44_15]OGY78138.1 MAG: UMP kinase [Candidatus Jacksonbacteria bacterium RIFOXYC2_FULL_44_29]OGY80954.1 MAG: UMP kinase [Candidatus Jacksonbacteria bacterium RIFOXYD2_FULL_43_21]HBH46728.1 UMP kinase [Candidatus Jacksonbacteria bacterium]